MSKEMESPDALAGAIGADEDLLDNFPDYTPEARAAATAIVTALEDLTRSEGLLVLEEAFAMIRPGQPIPPLIGIMDEAAFWADMASRTELKAYALTCYNRLSAADQRAFLEYVQGEAAA